MIFDDCEDQLWPTEDSNQRYNDQAKLKSDNVDDLQTDVRDGQVDLIVNCR